ncbi:hypothetical protein [Streptomyces sp. RPA4-5]|nr:hypothetical protein [Streptomyces sp. RPA4-5]
MKGVCGVAQGYVGHAERVAYHQRGPISLPPDVGPVAEVLGLL